MPLLLRSMGLRTTVVPGEMNMLSRKDSMIDVMGLLMVILLDMVRVPRVFNVRGDIREAAPMGRSLLLMRSEVDAVSILVISRLYPFTK